MIENSIQNQQIKKRLLTVNELAEYMGTTPKSIYTLKCKGKIPKACIIKRGKSLRFDIIEVDKWIIDLNGEANA